MRLKSISYEDLNSLNAKQLKTLLSRTMPQVRQNIAIVTKYVGTSQAVRSLLELYPAVETGEQTKGLSKVYIGGLPTEYQIRNELSYNELKELAFASRKFLKEKTSTLGGVRRSIDEILEKANYVGEDKKEVLSKMGGYRGFNDFLNIVDEIRKYDPSLEYQMGSDGSVMESMLKAFNDPDAISFEEMAIKAKEILIHVTEERRKEYGIKDLADLTFA